MKKQYPLKQFAGSLNPSTDYSPVESLLNLDSSSPWSHEILSDPTLRRYSKSRCQLISKLNHLFECVPSVQMDFGKAIALKLVTECEIASTYKLLISILNEEEYSERLLLYFPIELIPGKDWDMSPALARVADDFVEVYIRKWHALLLRQDIRANFVDGDIPETEIRTGPLPMVVKAAHLIPALISKGILTLNDVQIMIDECSNNILRNSIEEILPFCLTSDITPKSNISPRSMKWLAKKIHGNVTQIKLLRQIHLANLFDKPSKRVAWELERDEMKLIDRCASEIAEALINKTLNFKQFTDFLTMEVDQYSILVGVTSLQKTFDSLVQTDFIRTKNMYAECEQLINRLWDSNIQPIQERIEILWSHLLVVDIVKASYIEKDGVQIAQFNGNMSLNVNIHNTAVSITQAIQESGTLSRYLMPIALVYGSQIKGYATKQADTDIAIFVRPEINISERGHVKKLITKLLEPLGIADKVFEFWLEETSNGLRIRDFANPDRLLGDSLLAKILFGGVWFGNKCSIRKLYATVLSSYLNRTSKSIQGQPLREYLLEEMESDALQYRLMHKGYYRFHPERRTSCIPEKMVDSGGAFWDSGYRRLATRLFLKKVFLPYVPSTQN